MVGVEVLAGELLEVLEAGAGDLHGGGAGEVHGVHLDGRGQHGGLVEGRDLGERLRSDVGHLGVVMVRGHGVQERVRGEGRKVAAQGELREIAGGRQGYGVSESINQAQIVVHQ